MINLLREPSEAPATVEGSPAVRAVVATTPAERESAFSVRYAVYIDEQGKQYACADHRSRTMTDELDEDAAVILVSDFEGPCGTVRANWRSSSQVRATYDTQFQLERFGPLEPQGISICSRLAVLRRCRGTRVAGLLFREIYTVGIQTGTILSFAACASRLRPLFDRYGFREYIDPWDDPVVGRLHRLVLVLDDLEYLERVKSPFLEIAHALNVRHIERAWLTDVLASSPHATSCEQISSDESTNHSGGVA